MCDGPGTVHVIDLPPQFNVALLHLAEERWGWGVLMHGPYGAPLPPPLPTGWHNTSDYALEPLVHLRALQRHEPSLEAADVVLAPYYGGIALRLLGPQGTAGLEGLLFEHLANSTAWNAVPPARRLLALGIVANEFAQTAWGSSLLFRPQLAGVTVASIEARPGCGFAGTNGGYYGGTRVPAITPRRSCWGVEGELQTTASLVGVPYPPRSSRVAPARSLARHLRCGDPGGGGGGGEDDGGGAVGGGAAACGAVCGGGDAGASGGGGSDGDGGGTCSTAGGSDGEGGAEGGAARPFLAAYIGTTVHSGVTLYPERASLAAQCAAAPERCRGGEFASAEALLQAYAQADFCLQPAGDTATRRGLFDALAAGCVPVVLHAAQLRAQYPFHLPADPFDEEGGAAYLLPTEAHANALAHLAAARGGRRRPAPHIAARAHRAAPGALARPVYARDTGLAREAVGWGWRSTAKLASGCRRHRAPLPTQAAVPRARVAALRAAGASVAAGLRYDFAPREGGGAGARSPPDAFELLLRGVARRANGCTE